MYGYMVPAKRWQTKEERVLGMPLVRLEVSKTALRKLDRQLKRARVDRLLEQEPTLGLWRARAVECCLLLLEGKGLLPTRSSVEFFSCSPLSPAPILPFLPHVKTISLSAPNGDELAWTLQREYGVAARLGAGDISVCFSPARRSLALPLYEPQPAVPGLELWAQGLDLPPDCPTQGAIAALVSRGKLEQNAVKIRANFS